MSTAQLIADIEAFVDAGSSSTTNAVTGVLMNRFGMDADFRVSGSTSTMLYSGRVGAFSSNDNVRQLIISCRNHGIRIGEGRHVPGNAHSTGMCLGDHG